MIENNIAKLKPEKVLAPRQKFWNFIPDHLHVYWIDSILVIINPSFLLTLKGTVWTVQCTNNKNYSSVIKNELNQVLRRSCKTWLLANLSSANKTSPLSNTNPNMPQYYEVKAENARLAFVIICLWKKIPSKHRSGYK